MHLRIPRPLRVACVGALLGFLVAPPAADAQTRLRCQSTFPTPGMMAENMRYFADRVRTISGGRLEIEVLPAGAVVPAFETLDATHRRIIDCAHSAAAYWLGRNRAVTLFGPAPGGPFGMDTLDYLAWLQEGGGQALYQELYRDVLRRNVVPIPLSAVSPQSLGWFRTPVRTWEDLRGRKCRQVGITAELFSRGAGMATVVMPGGEIIPAAERGVIECAEWTGPAEDMRIGLHTVFKYFYVNSTHEPATVLELLINGDAWAALPREHQELIRMAANEATLRSIIMLNINNAAAITELRERHGVNVQRTPDDILRRTLETWDAIASEEEARNEFFRKVYASQRAFAQRVVPGRRFTHVEYRMAADHYWPETR
jgi:TRAP-type mannitol/chloroaromatic compound transport system substrate-binding protein